MRKYKLLIILMLVIMLLFINKKGSAYGFGVKKNHNHTTPDIGKYEPILKSNNAFYVGDDSEKKVYLTFDWGYENGYTNLILDVLKEKNVKATFFITGHYLTSATDIVKRMASDGHVIGNHSYKHKDITKLNAQEIQNEIESLNVKYKELIGEEMSSFYRPPAGSFDDRSLKVVASMGYTTLFWSIAYEDWNNKKIDVKSAVMENIHNGAIILMHAVSSENAAALGELIDALTNDGYQITSTYDLTKKRLD